MSAQDAPADDDPLDALDDWLDEQDDPDDVVVALVDELRTAREERAELQARGRHHDQRLADHHDRLGRLESTVDIDIGDLEAGIPASFDARDRRVLRVLENNQREEVTSGQLGTLYERQTDVRSNNTKRNRVKRLVEDGPFEKIGTGRWRYLGFGDLADPTPAE